VEAQVLQKQEMEKQSMLKHELLRLDGIKKSFGTTEVLRGIDLTVGKVLELPKSYGE